MTKNEVHADGVARSATYRAGTFVNVTNDFADVTNVTIQNLTKSTTPGNVVPTNPLTTESLMFDHTAFAAEYRRMFNVIVEDDNADTITTSGDVTTITIESPNWHDEELTIASDESTIVVRRNGQQVIVLSCEVSTPSEYAVAIMVNGLACIAAE